MYYVIEVSIREYLYRKSKGARGGGGGGGEIFTRTVTRHRRHSERSAITFHLPEAICSIEVRYSD